MNTIIEYSQRRPLIFGVGVVIAVSALALLLAVVIRAPAYLELQRALYTASVGLLFTGLVGSLLKRMIDNDALARSKGTEDAAFITNILDDLKGVHDRVGRARILIAAHKSVKTYGIEMRDLIDACVQLKNVIRALQCRTDGKPEAAARATIESDVERMERYLQGLTDEFIAEYKRLSDLQRLAEQQTLSSEDLWSHLAQLPRLQDLLTASPSSRYQTEFQDALKAASKALRDQQSLSLRARSAL